ncbi:MAG: AtpZ/AtpI family protein [Candidatus Riflebacteria bacterium]|nr:AtpZ/AtpI family protein [Candidatus Riflebacteria bacterium]
MSFLPGTEKKGWTAKLADVGDLLALGLTIGLCIAFGLAAGWGIDKWLGTAPWGVLLGIFWGIAAAVVQAVRVIRACERRLHDTSGGDK